MTAFTTTHCLSATVAALAFGAAPVLAQDNQSLSEEEVKNFFDNAEQELTEMIEADEFEGLINWTQEGLADEAHIYASVESYAGDQRKTFSVFMLNKEDVTELGQIALGMMASAQGQGHAIEDYSLDIKVADVAPAGSDAATVTTHITESATLALPDGEDAGAVAVDEDAQAGAATDAAENGDRSLSIEATADCHMLIRRADEDDRLLLGLTACNATISH